MNLFHNKYLTVIVSNRLLRSKPLVGLVLILIVQAAASTAYAQSTPPAVKDPGTQGPPPTVMSLEVADPMFSSRYGMESFLRQLDSEFVFKQGPNVNGQEEFSATDSHNTSAEIIGSERDMQTVKWTIGFNTDRDVNLKETYRLANFLNTVAGQEAVQWFYNQTPKNLKAHPLDDYTETKEFDGRNIKFEYRPKLRQASMTVFMKK
jgi:hypothetical protein